MHGTTWTVAVAPGQSDDGFELFTSVRLFHERARPGGGFSAPVPDPRTPVHIATGRTDELPPWVLVRTAPDVMSAVVYGTSGRRYDLALTEVDAELDLRFGAVLFPAGDRPGHLVAHRDDGCSIVECALWGHMDRWFGTPDPVPGETPREVYRRALAAAGSRPAGPDEQPALRALAHGARAPRERAAEVLCTYLRGPGVDPGVRREIGRILGAWLRAGATRLDLVGATLVDLDLAGCRLEDCDFSAATLQGDTRLGGTTFTRHAWFAGATFDGDVDLTGARVGGTAEFHRTTFTGGAVLDGVVVEGDAVFTAATFRADMTAVGATVGGRTWLDDALVRGIVDVTRTRFENGVDLDDTDVAGHVLFGDVTFGGSVELGTARVRGQVVLDGARARPSEDGTGRWPRGWTLEPDADTDGYRRVR